MANELVKVDPRNKYPQQTVTATRALIGFLGRILKATDQHLNPPTPEGQIPQAAISALYPDKLLTESLPDFLMKSPLH